MTEDEAKKILKTVRAAYPAAFRDTKRPEGLDMVRNWQALEPYETVKAIVHEWIADSPFPPKLADIRRRLDASKTMPSREELQSMARFRLRQTESGEFTVRGRSGTPEDIEEFKAKWRDFL